MTRKLTLVFFIVLLLPLHVFAHGNLKFVNGRWFDGTRFVAKTMYSVDNVFREHYDGELRATIDLGGRYIIPPLADAHNHVLADGGPHVDEQLRQYLRAGIFYVKNPNNVLKLTEATRARMNQPESVDVRWANGGLTATGGHPAQIYDRIADAIGWKREDMLGQAYFFVDSEADLARLWPTIRAGKPDFIKTYLEHSEEFAKRKDDPRYYGQRGLDPRVLAAIVKRAHADGLRVTTHLTTTADFHNAIAAGVDEIAHLPLAPIDPADAALAAKQHVTVVTTVLSHRPTTGIGDPMALHRANLALLKRAGVTIVLGTDNGEKTVVDEAEAVARLGVFTNLELLRMWTNATPHAIFPERTIGTLADGAEASFLALDEDPLANVSAVRKIAIRVKQGHVIDVPPEKPGVADVLLPLARSRGASTAIDEYWRLVRDEPAHYDYGEAQLNRLGYQLINDHLDAALAIFAFNAEQFPTSANVWDSLAEAQMKAGKRDEAIANYRKSLALNPHNANAAAMLKKLGEP
ncbi:MAG: amidohydrolase family protein [Acidobacteria bacterium]|nr:amidohydrolase family protein [Acidobacteriota bacterium]MBV9475158.1 amidohydrolase family protein [Acidobacteriota bacterium]